MLFDILGAVTSLLSTYFFIRVNNKAWLFGLLAISMNSYLYWKKGIYADMCLEFFYFVSLSYGWYRWTKQSSQPTVAIRSATGNEWCWLVVITTLLYFSIYYILTTFTHSTIAKLDACTTALSIMGQVLICHKILATWVFWFLADVCYTYLYLAKDLPYHGLLMVIYTGMAVAGFFHWYAISLNRESMTWLRLQAFRNNNNFIQ